MRIQAQHQAQRAAVAPPPIIAVLPSEGFVRQRDLIGDPNSVPAVVGVLPVSKTTLWRWIREGRFPAPTRLGPNSVAWKVSDIRAYLQGTVEKAA